MGRTPLVRGRRPRQTWLTGTTLIRLEEERDQGVARRRGVCPTVCAAFPKLQPAPMLTRKRSYRGAYPIPDKLQTRTMRTTMVNATYSLSRSIANAITENATLAIGVAISNNNPN